MSIRKLRLQSKRRWMWVERGYARGRYTNDFYNGTCSPEAWASMREGDERRLIHEGLLGRQA